MHGTQGHGRVGAAVRERAQAGLLTSTQSGTQFGTKALESLQILYLHEQHPKAAETFEVAPGILWARVPLPFRLNHVNCWLVREADGWTLVDTGTANPEARAVWDTLFTGVLSGAPIVRLVATHGHTDHVGLSGWLYEKAGGVPFHMTLVEWLSATLRIDEARSPLRPENLKFLNMHGCDADTIEGFADERRRTHAQMVPLPPAIQRLRNGTMVTFGGRQWETIVCGGHAAEHASFWCASDNILIAGDQVLSKISPMIGVFPTEPDADPLSDYLGSLDRFRALPADALVLPSHGLPFTGLHTRVEELAHHHALRLTELERLMAAPSGNGGSNTAMHLARGLFPKPVAEGQARHAFAETLAHAHYLLAHGRAVRAIDGNGQFVFRPMR